MSSFNDETRKTDHSEEIKSLRDRAAAIKPFIDLPNSGALFRRDYNLLQAGAALLEVHDATGISLDEWVGPREFVEDLIGAPITENHV